MTENVNFEYASDVCEAFEVDDEIVEGRKTPFNKLERAALLSVLEECTNALADFRHTHQERAPYIDNEFSHDPVEESYAHAQDILEETKQELRESGYSTILAKVTKELQTKQEMEETLLKDYRETVEGIKSIRRTITEEVEANSREKKQYEDTLFNSECEVKLIQLKCAAESSYVSSWENARCEQNAMRCCMAEENLIRALDKCSTEEKNEIRVMGEIDKYLRQNIAHNEKEITSWQCRYLAELETYTADIVKLRKGIEARRDVVEKLKEEFSKKQEFIDTYLSEKEAIRQQEKYVDHVKSSAISIQSWWRGIMVRRKLGPFRPEERKKKRTAKSKK